MSSPSPSRYCVNCCPNQPARGLIPRSIEDPIPLCAVKRDLKNQGENDDASNLGLSDLIEYWRRNDRGWGWGGRSGEGGPPRRLPEKVTDHGPSTAVGDGVEGAGKGDPRDGCRRKSQTTALQRRSGMGWKERGRGTPATAAGESHRPRPFR